MWWNLCSIGFILAHEIKKYGTTSNPLFITYEELKGVLGPFDGLDFFQCLIPLDPQFLDASKNLGLFGHCWVALPFGFFGFYIIVRFLLSTHDPWRSLLTKHCGMLFLTLIQLKGSN